MGPLKNPRHERFVQRLFEGKSAVDAHEQAGYARDDGNAARLAANPRIRERLTELQSAIAAENKVTVESLLNELEEARQKATSLDQLSAATAAIMGKAKISGLLINRTEIGAPGDFSKCQSTEEVVDEMLRFSGNSYHDLRDEDRSHIIALYNRDFEELGAYIQMIKDRPPRGSYTEPKRLPYLNNSAGNGKSPI
jgi:hypothetical protein